MNNHVDIRTKKDGHRITVFVKGFINTDTAPMLNTVLQSLSYDGLDLTVDMAETDYITSAGLRTLLIARKKLTDNTMRVVHVNESVADVFAVTGFDTLIRVEKHVAISEENRLSLVALLQKRVETDGNHTAYVFKDREYTWNDVDMASHIVADELAALGVKKGTHVGICSPNSQNFVFTIFAIQKLGGIAVLINPGLRPEEVCTLVDIADVTHLCFGETDGKTFSDMYESSFLSGGVGRRFLDISSKMDFAGQQARFDGIKEQYRELYHADMPAAIIFSSGSTGVPKAVLSSSYSMISGTEPILKSMPISGTDINLAFLPMFHIFGFAMGISAGLITGYTSVIPQDKSPVTMVELIEKYGCTIFSTVPTMMLALLGVPSFSPDKLKSLRIIFLGGATTTEKQLLMLQGQLPHVHFCNVYGMSENPVVSITAYSDSVEHITRTVGKPVKTLELMIRDLDGKEIQRGEQGEICIRGDSMVVCYYKLPVEKQPLDEEGWLLTGDLGFLDGEGYLHITGRKKDLIICGGENISPGEIADVLWQLSEIADVNVLGIPDELWGEIVTAAVIVKPGCRWDEEKVRAFAAEKLAKYKLPVHYVVLDSFPMLGSGKTDVVALKQMVTDKIKASKE